MFYLAHMGMLSWFNTDYRAAPMPHELEGLVGQTRTGGNARLLIPMLIGVSLFAMIAALLWDLHLYSTNGASAAATYAWVSYKGSEPWAALASWLHYPKPPNRAGMIGATPGVVVMLLLSALRSRFGGFPLVPAAYALNTSFANDFFWCDMLVAWLAKVLILRFGGMRLYRTALPFFLGLILGDFVTGSAWSLIGAIFHLNLYRTFVL
jgi:hypothetical protein